MAVEQYEKVQVTDREYHNHYYQVELYSKTKKINLISWELGNKLFLKMSLEETKDLITRLTYAVYEAENG